jgi:hypothetical protein
VVTIIYKGKKYKHRSESLKLAQKRLIEFQIEIQNIKDLEIQTHNNMPIIKNKHCVAIITLQNKKMR